MRARRTRLLGAATAAAALAVTVSGCVTVDGEHAMVTPLTKREARAALERFVTTSNKANREYDAELNATVETGALGAIDQAGLRANKKIRPEGAENYRPLRLSDPRFLIPRQAGRPKFFVVDAKSNRQGPGRWFLVFARETAGAPWKAAYLSTLEDSEVPEFATDADGRVEAVPTGHGSRLAVAPDKLSRTYVDYLKGGGTEFASGPHTSGWRERRAKAGNQAGVRNEFADQAAEPPQFAPFALRTKDGGALAFFASQHHTKQTVAKGHRPAGADEPLVKALLTGEVKQAVTYIRTSEQAVVVPPRKEKGGKIAFLNRIDGLTAARGS